MEVISISFPNSGGILVSNDALSATFLPLESREIGEALGDFIFSYFLNDSLSKVKVRVGQKVGFTLTSFIAVIYYS